MQTSKSLLWGFKKLYSTIHRFNSSLLYLCSPLQARSANTQQLDLITYIPVQQTVPVEKDTLPEENNDTSPPDTIMEPVVVPISRPEVNTIMLIINGLW